MNIQLLQSVIALVQRAGALIVGEAALPTGPRGSGDKADVDLEVEGLLREGLLRLLPCDFVGEETGMLLKGAEACWVVDPNDGTSDFLRTGRGSAISVGLLVAQEPVLGVVYAPLTHALLIVLPERRAPRDFGAMARRSSRGHRRI